ncbi:hypothetical protein TIFTF001_014004 [Ficus carica]|uniref:Uncharacterized protein n=1 Tax=Ficus carica TaxID=3494 RepID=A0AA88D577_FICCA|nr:hypothetical protein TIFTF001_014004 [Ficus carica]
MIATETASSSLRAKKIARVSQRRDLSLANSVTTGLMKLHRSQISASRNSLSLQSRPRDIQPLPNLGLANSTAAAISTL